MNENQVITPQIAAELLTSNTRNRPLRRSAVDFYSSEMKKGQWRLNGESIKISKTGVIIDGQHRLQAVIDSGISINTYITTGIEDDVFDTVDTGIKRTAADSAHLMGCKNAKNVMAIARWVHSYEYFESRDGFQGCLTTQASARPSNHDLINLYSSHPELSIITTKLSGDSKIRQVYASIAIAGFLMWLAYNDDADVADLFFDSLKTGALLGEDDPVLRLRERLISDRSALKRMKNNERLALSIKAYNSFKRDQPIKTLRWRQLGSNPELFPILGD